VVVNEEVLSEQDSDLPLPPLFFFDCWPLFLGPTFFSAWAPAIFGKSDNAPLATIRIPTRWCRRPPFPDDGAFSPLLQIFGGGVVDFL